VETLLEAEWEVTVTTAEGSELEFEIPQARYDALKNGDTVQVINGELAR
jgi:hypothetical protein